MANPYAELPPRAFWRSAVAQVHPLQIRELWTPKFTLEPSQRCATLGSCFAQHIGRALVSRGYAWLDAEPAPRLVPAEVKRRFNYGVFSARTGNVYTARALLQWLRWALGVEAMPDLVWSEGGRLYDPFRPTIEPNGFASEAELRASQQAVLAALRRLVETADVLVFTLGLTEVWLDREGGFAYPLCPGTVPGARFEPERHRFVNLRYQEIAADLRAALALLRERNPRLRCLLTVSPVPLTATAAGQHVLVATTHSKSVLRAVAGELAAEAADVDYFPAYELITGIPFRSMFYEPNLRSVAPEGVAHVMKLFFAATEAAAGGGEGSPAAVAAAASPAVAAAASGEDEAAELVCEEELLAAFGAPEAEPTRGEPPG